MADTYSSGLQLLLMQDGSHPNTWGDLTNTNLSLIDQRLTQVTAISVTNANYPLTNNAAAQSQARSLAFNVTGTLSAAVAIQLPAGFAGLYVFFNQVTNSGTGTGNFLLTVQNGTGAPIGAVAALAGPTTNGGNGVANLIYTDGTNVYGAQPPGQFAQLNVYQAYAVGTAWTPVAVTLSGGPGYTGTIDTSKSNEFYVQAPAGATSLTFVLSNSATGGQLPGQTIQVAVSQNGTGGAGITWPAGVLWPQGITPSWSTSPNATDLVTLTYTYVQGSLVWVGNVFQNYGAVGSSGGTYNVKVLQSDVNLTILSLLNSTPGAAVTVNLTIAPNVVLNATSTAYAALDLSGLPSGSIINLNNFGYIVGAGGNGGPGAFGLSGYNPGTAQNTYIGQAATAGANTYSTGQNGGNAIKGPGVGNTLNVFNASGHIWGGGGGGGGGGAAFFPQPGSWSCSAGGGGGGGAGGGIGGTAYQGGNTAVQIVGVVGGNGVVVPNSGVAAGGGGATAGPSTNAGGGGAGGNWGQPGAAGTAAVLASATIIGYGNGGLAGNAITASGTINLVTSGDIQGPT